MRYSSTFCALLLLASSTAFSEAFFVRLPDLGTITVDMHLDNDVEALHDYLEPISGVPKQLLFLTLNGRPLDPQKNLRLRDLDLGREMTIFASVKSLCCVRCNPITAMHYLFSTVVYCVGAALFMNYGNEQLDLCDCTDLPTDED